MGAWAEGRAETAAGVWVVDKPGGLTSLDVVRRLKRCVRGPVRMGHTGTLDPMATGVLPVCVGEATRLIPYMVLEPKTYRGTMRLGVETDTWDVTGRVVAEKKVPELSEEEILAAFTAEEGLRLLEAPMFSAIKYKGRPLYRYARRGESVEVPPRECRIESLRLTERRGETLGFEITCSRGTYVRSVVQSVGRRFGCGAALASLRRLRCGRFRIEEAYPLEGLEREIEEGKGRDALLSPVEILGHLEALEVDEEDRSRLRHGNPLRVRDLRRGAAGAEGERRIRLMVGGEVAAVAEVREDDRGPYLQPVRVLPPSLWERGDP